MRTVSGVYGSAVHEFDHHITVTLEDGRTIQVRKSDLRPTKDGSPNHFELDEKAKIHVFPRSQKPPINIALVFIPEKVLEQNNVT